AAAGEDDALLGLDRLLLAALRVAHAHDLAGGGVLDEVLVVAIELHVDAQLLALGVQLVEGGHAEALHVGHADDAGVGAVVEEPVLGDGARQRLLGHLVGHAVLVGVLGVALGLGDVGVDHLLFHLALGERRAVRLELVGILDDGPFAVVDAAVAAALDGSLLEAGHAAPAFGASD